jgi:high-affinity iron transporter
MKKIIRLLLLGFGLLTVEQTVQMAFAHGEAVAKTSAFTNAGVFGQSFLIIVREGVEVILILGAISAVLIKSGARDKLRIVRSALMVSLLASVATGVLSVIFVRSISDAHREILEGATLLLAAIVLFFVSHWLISRAEAKQWVDFLKSKVQGSLDTGRAAALWLVCFLAVYREGAETVLFYHGLASSVSGRGGAIAAGFGVGCVVLIVLYLLFRRGIMRIPTRPFFRVTSAFLYVMAFIFAGKAIHEFQEAGVIAESALQSLPKIKFLGIYPTVQTLVVQAVIVLAAAASVLWVLQRQRQTAPVPVVADESNRKETAPHVG